MKVLLLLTSHQQLEEVYLYGEFIKRFCPIVKTFDLLLYVNKIDIDISRLGNYFQGLPFENKTLVLTSKNTGYTFGAIEALADYFELFKTYDYVIHSHPDVFITSDVILWKLLEYFSYRDETFIVNRTFGKEDITTMAADFFIFKPKSLKVNIFDDYKNYLNKYNLHTGGVETVLYEIVNKYNIPHFYIKRYDNDYWNPRRVDLLGIWHEHNLVKIQEYLRNN